MATQVQFRRGTTGETAVFTGAIGEVTVDTDINTVVVHDGSTAGGFYLARNDGTNLELSPGSLSSCALRFASDANTGIIRTGPDTMALVTGGVARVTIDSSGTSTVTGNLIVTGSITAQSGLIQGDVIPLILALS